MTIEEIREQLTEELKRQRYIVRHSHPIVTSARRHLNVAPNKTNQNNRVSESVLAQRLAFLNNLKQREAEATQRCARWAQEEF